LPVGRVDAGNDGRVHRFSRENYVVFF
jgi:hypothetical protein